MMEPTASASVSTEEQESLDFQTRVILIGAGIGALAVLFAIGLTIFVMVVNNWNILNWLE